MHEKVKELLLGNKPCAIGKIGSIELAHFYNTFANNKNAPSGASLAINAGINCQTVDEYLFWIDSFKHGLQSLDAILAWNNNFAEDQIISTFCQKNILAVKEFPDIEPFDHGDNGWHYALADKKVLVISSFKDSIESQIPNFGKIWNGAKLSDCEVIRCPQPFQITGESPSWFIDNYQELTEEILKKDFDIAIVGAGGYSLPLCGYIKCLGKSAIHLGGATQVLFGIRGSRFDRNFADKDWYGTDDFIKPLESDVPKYKQLVEESCYW